jgi:hypothetical protein
MMPMADLVGIVNVASIYSIPVELLTEITIQKYIPKRKIPQNQRLFSSNVNFA